MALLKETGASFDVRKNDEIPLNETELYSHIILSPGPSLPKDSGNLLPVIQHGFPTHPILGICLGHQAIAESFGGKLLRLSHPRHGMQCEIYRCAESELFQSTPLTFKGGLYHSWTVSHESFPEDLRITSQSNEGDILSIEHKQYPVFGIQFHPESFMSEYGMTLIRNFISIV